MNILFSYFLIACITTDVKGQINQGTGERIIPGPRSINDRIAVIGAGPSGIHMAYRLKELGFRNVEILEIHNRIGGRVFDIQHRGTVQQLTFYLLHPDYKELRRIIHKFTKGNIIQPSREHFNFFDIAREIYPDYTRGKTDNQLKAELLKEISRYVTLHRRLFGSTYTPYLMPRPNAQVRREIRGTLRDFLRRNKMPLIETVIAYSFIVRGGYGQPDRIAALYGLMWLTPHLFEKFLNPNETALKYLDIGMLNVLQTLVRRFNINIRFNVHIQRILRGRNSPYGNIRIMYTLNSDPARRLFVSNYDFLIVSPPMRHMFPIMDISPTERNIFGLQVTDTYFVSSLVDSPFGIRQPFPAETFMDGLLKYDFDPYASTDVYAMEKNITGERYRLGLAPGGEDGLNFQSAVYYQVGHFDPRIPAVYRDVETRLRKHMEDRNRILYSIISRIVTPYFTRFLPRDIDTGVIWDVFDLQGHRNTWYIGGSLTFDSCGAVIQYNDKILRNYIPPLPPARK